MAIINRVSRLLRADLHAVLDRVEEPGVLLRQAVRDMEEALGDQRRSARRIEHEVTGLRAREGDLERVLAETREQLDICFDAGKDDLARALLRRRLETERTLREVAERRERLARELEAMDSRLAENRLRLEAMRQKADLLASAESEEPAPCETFAAAGVSDDEVEVAFLREQRRRAGP